MIMFIRCVITFAAIINVIAFEVKDTNLKDVSLSREVKKDIEEIDDPNRRSRMENLAKRDKYLRTHFLPVMGYVRYVCAANEIKVDLEYIHPELRENSDYKTFTENLGEYPQGFWTTVALYSTVERQCPPSSQTDTASWKMPNFYKLMYASIIGCLDPYYERHMTLESTNRVLSLRALVLKVNGLTESSDETLQNEAFQEFAFSYARILHGCNGFHHMVETRLRKNGKDYLPEVLYRLGFLQAWDFSEKDLKYLNALRVYRHEPEILTKSYRFEVMKLNEKKMLTGILPIMDIEDCPRF